jgi:hypothetical protein
VRARFARHVPKIAGLAHVTFLVCDKRGRHKENDMKEIAFISRYERRVSFVQEVIAKNSTLGDEVARALAVQVVYAIDHIPEPAR